MLGGTGLGNIFGAIPGFAGGTSFAPGGLARINERGGEIVNLPSGAQVIPHDLSKRMRGGGTVVNYAPVYNVHGASSADMAQLRAQVAGQAEEFKKTFGAKVAAANGDPRFRGSF